MSQERLIRLAESHRFTNFADKDSVRAANAIADSIRSLLARASDIEMVDYIRQESLASWVAFYVIESPEKYSFLIDEAMSEIKLMANRDGPESSAAKMALARIRDKH